MSDGFTLLKDDPATGVSVWIKAEGENLVIRTYQRNLDAIFTANNEAEAATNGRRFGDWNRIASVPHHLVYQNGLNEAIEQRDDRYISKVLNDADNRKFRTSRGRV